MAIQRKAPTETENPHIKREIKGFVEFPRAVRTVGSKSRHWGSKLECQKAQLRVLLKQKSPIRSNNLIMSLRYIMSFLQGHIVPITLKALGLDLKLETGKFAGWNRFE
ncbi:hypothetical protein GOBAR_DD06650 [Gossypium barbadense]|nr:hypothetical protein GOBAR_DD06650 [Gossypium barbadense]